MVAPSKCCKVSLTKNKKINIADSVILPDLKKTMANLSPNISNLVFRRNIPFKLETYVLNCEMLQVLVEMDGVKNVAAIATILNKQVGDLINTFATLYQQKLIFLVNSNPPVASKSNLNTQNSNPLKNLNAHTAGPSLHSLEKNLAARPALKRNPVSRNVHNSFNHKSSSNHHSDYLSQAYPASNCDGMSEKASQSGFSNFRIGTTMASHGQGTNLFNINKSHAIASKQKTDTAYKNEPYQDFRKERRRPRQYSNAQVSPRQSQDAIECFERGVAFLERRSYKKALKQFKRSLYLDPKNRLCRANILRIERLLKNHHKISSETTH